MEQVKFGPIRFIPGANRGRYPFCHSVYIEGARVLIDPSSDRELIKAIFEEDGVNAVWLSHWHEDHMMHLDLLEGVPLWIAEPDLPPLLDLETFLDWYDMEEPHYRDYWRKAMVETFHYKPRRPEGLLRPGEIMDLGTVTVRVIPTPGHTPGHVALKFLEEDVLFIGDYDLSGFGPWYGDRFSSIEETVQSVQVLRSIPARRWIASHETGVFTEPPGELWDRYLGVIDKREERLLEVLKEPKTLEEIARSWIVYGRPREPEAFYLYGEKAIMKKHLKRLLSQGVIVRDGKFYRRSN